MRQHHEGGPLTPEMVDQICASLRATGTGVGNGSGNGAKKAGLQTWLGVALTAIALAAGIVGYTARNEAATATNGVRAEVAEVRTAVATVKTDLDGHKVAQADTLAALDRRLEKIERKLDTLLERR